MEHYPNCNANYPEKAKGERPQATTDVDLGEGTLARTCNDCGSFEIVRRSEPEM